MAKPRVIISTDIGGPDPNDKQELAHALLNTDKIDLKALISTPTAHSGRVSDIYKTIDAYAQDYHNLSTWSSDYPTADHLKGITYQGSINVPGSAGYSSSTAASQAIVREAHAASPSDPLYVLAWGALTDVAQALHDDPSIMPNIRLIAANGWNSTQDPNSYKYVYNNFKDLWFIEAKSTHRGVYLAPDGSANNGFDMSKVTGSALGNYFKAAQGYMNDGDSFSLLYLLDNADNNNPTSSSSWGGAFIQNGHGAHYWTDNPAKSYAGYAGAATIVAHRSEVFNDFYTSFAHAKTANPNAGSTTTSSSGSTSTTGDHPVVANDDSVTATKSAALVVNVMSNDSAPDHGHVTNVNANSSQGGHVVINSDGTLTYTPKAGFIGTDGFGYMVKDADGDWDTATVHVTVKDGTTTVTPPTTTSGDHPVTAVSDHLDAQKGAATVLNVLANDSAPDGGLHVTNINANSAQGGHVVLNADSTVTYTPKAGFTGTDSFGYMAKDGDGDWGVATTYLTVKDGVATTQSLAQADTSAPAPTTSTGGISAGTDSYNIDAGKTLYFNSRYLTTNDKGGDGNYSITSVDAKSEHGVSVSWGAEGTAQDGTTVYKAPTDFSGTDHVHYTVVDASGHTGTGTIDIQVHPLLLA